MIFKNLSLKTIFKFFLIFLIPFALEANPDEIEIRDTGICMNFVNRHGKIKAEYLPKFIQKTEVNGNIKSWHSFKTSLDSDKKKSIAGEVAAQLFFKDRGYKILEEHYNARIALLKGNKKNEGMYKDMSCTSKKGPDNGIDGLFFLQEESLENHSHIVVNEAKFRDKLSLSATTDFGVVAGKIQQSHSNWNRPRLSWPSCLPNLDYDKEVIVRTATLLDKKGTLKLYEIRDKDEGGKIIGEYASEAPANWNIRKVYDKNIK